MKKKDGKTRLLVISGVAIVGVTLAGVFSWTQPFDSYLLHRWERELQTIPDQEVPARVGQIAGLGERGFPTLIAALHSDREVVANAAYIALQRELVDLERQATDETSPVVAELAQQLAELSGNPGPYARPAAASLATRILLWPIDRKRVDGEQLVADCELIIRSTDRVQADDVRRTNYQTEFDETRSDSVAREFGSVDALPPVPGGGLPVQLVDTPALPPPTPSLNPSHPLQASTEPEQFVPVRAPRSLDLQSIASGSMPTSPPIPPSTLTQPPERFDLQDDATPELPPSEARQNLLAMPDLDVIKKLAGGSEAMARAAVDELYRRGYQTKHVRLAALLVDPDPRVRLQMVRELPQMAGIDSRPWLLWLSRDQDPEVRKAAVSVIATSSDPALRQRVEELERTEMDDEILEVVRQILNRDRANARR